MNKETIKKKEKKNLFNIISIKIITSLATVDSSSFCIYTVLPKTEPAFGSGVWGWDDSQPNPLRPERTQNPISIPSKKRFPQLLQTRRR